MPWIPLRSGLPELRGTTLGSSHLPPAIGGARPSCRARMWGLIAQTALPQRGPTGTAALPDTRCAPGSREGDAAIMRPARKLGMNFLRLSWKFNELREKEVPPYSHLRRQMSGVRTQVTQRADDELVSSPSRIRVDIAAVCPTLIVSPAQQHATAGSRVSFPHIRIALPSPDEGGAIVPHIDITCPHCSHRNDIHASDLPMTLGVHCSHCHAPLGTWDELRTTSEARGNASPMKGGGRVPMSPGSDTADAPA